MNTNVANAYAKFLRAQADLLMVVASENGKAKDQVEEKRDVYLNISGVNDLDSAFIEEVINEFARKISDGKAILNR